MMNKELIKQIIAKWLNKNRLDMLENQRRDRELEETIYNRIVDELISDQFTTFQSEDDILQSNSIDVIEAVLNRLYGYSIYSIIDSVWEEKYPDIYEKYGQTGILSYEIVNLVNHYKKQGITIENIVDEPQLEGLPRIEADEKGIKLFTEEQFRKIIELKLVGELL